MADARIVVTRPVDADDLLKLIEPKMRNLGDAIAKRARRLVPKRTFKLLDTIETETSVEGRRVVTSVSAGGGEVNYALYVERGTSRMAAQPYLRPAMLQTRAADLE